MEIKEGKKRREKKKHRGLDVTASLSGEINDHGAWPHRLNHLLGDQFRRRFPGNERRRDNDVHVSCLYAFTQRESGRTGESARTHIHKHTREREMVRERERW
jgi:hypothetical protein